MGFKCPAGIKFRLRRTEVINGENAIDAGYRSIDTAAYYQNETGVGKLFAKVVFPGRDFITTKVWNSDQYHSTLKAFENSRQNCVEYIDLHYTLAVLVNTGKPESFNSSL